MALSHVVQVTSLLTCDALRRWLGRDQPVGTEGVRATGTSRAHISPPAMGGKAERPGKLRAREAQNSHCVTKGPGGMASLGLEFHQRGDSGLLRADTRGRALLPRFGGSRLEEPVLRDPCMSSRAHAGKSRVSGPGPAFWPALPQGKTWSLFQAFPRLSP